MNTPQISPKVPVNAGRDRTLLELNNAIITNLTQDTLLDAICEALQHVLPVYRAAINLYNPEKDTLRMLALSKNWKSDYFRVGVEINRKDSHSGLALEHLRPLVCEDIETVLHYPCEQLLFREGVRSYCIAPLILRGKTIGTLNLGSDLKGRYSEEHGKFLNEVAGQVALAIGNMKAFEDIAALNAKVELTAERYRSLLGINNAIITNLTRDSLFDAVCTALERIVPVYRAAISLFDPEKGTLRIYALSREWKTEFFRVGTEVGRSESHSGWVMDHRRPLIRRDLEAEREFAIEQRLLDEGIRSYCAVPLVLRGTVIGTMNVGSDAKNRYSETDAKFLQEVANQVALAVGNMKSFEEIATLSNNVECTAQRYRTLLEINNAIVTNLNREALLHAIAESLHIVIPFDRAAFTLYDPEKDNFRFLAIEGLVGSTHFRAGLEFRREDSISGWVFDQQRSALCHDIRKEQRYPNDRYLIAEGLNSYCVVPLIVGRKTIGTLNLASKKTGQYCEEDAEFLCELASQVALAVSNMTSYEQIATLNTTVERTAERYRTLLEVNNAVITHLTPEALIGSLSAILRRIVPSNRGVVLTIHDPATDTFRYLAIDSPILSEHFRPGREFDRQETVSAWVVDHRRPVVRRDIEKEQQYPNDGRLVAGGILSDCIVPLLVAGKCIGTLNVGSPERNQYSEEDVETLQGVANQVALAVANMQAFQEIVDLKARLETENVYLQEEIRTEHNFEEIIGSSPPLLAVLRKVEQVAPTDSTVLINGETGTGKELIARAVHDRSSRNKRPLLKVNCSAISAGLVESELFGHVKGAFTGAFDRHIGRFELADGGTIFLDEIGELPLDTQVKLLRVLQEREFEPVGSNKPVHVDVRVIAATNRNLQESIRTGRFRSDLFYRLNVFPIDVPSLRERRSDIPQIAMFFLARYSKKFGKEIQGIARATLDRLTNYAWPGNIRELQNVIERAVILAQSSVLELEPDLIPVLAPADASLTNDLPSGAAAASGSALPSPSTMEEVERSHIIEILNQTNGVVEGPRGAAKILDLHPNTLRHRMQKLGIRRTSYRES
jgi:formate hydrogenlyase transcriptional activator